jgi:hypothetical protein
VTAALIEAARRRQPPSDREQLAELMKEMSARLSAIEARLEEQGSQAGD